MSKRASVDCGVWKNVSDIDRRGIGEIGPVTKVRHPTMGDGKVQCHVNSDLIFLGSVPVAVLVWEQRPDGDYPAVTVTLDPAYLHKINWPEAEYLYELSIEDPRGAFGSDMEPQKPQMTEQSSEPIPNGVPAEAIRLNDDCKLRDNEPSVSLTREQPLALGSVSELALSQRKGPLPANAETMIRRTKRQKRKS